MRIASNTPASFYPREEYEFVHLGESVESVDIVILMLPKNWGSGYINKIEAITYWVSKYDHHVPCFIVGCESTIPDININRYGHEERDKCIKKLCDEVLNRSTSIGVRGIITYLYLTNILGYGKDSVDILYEYNSRDNYERMDGFLTKNKLPHVMLKDFIRFQESPFVFYEKPIDQNNIINIFQPYISYNGNKSRVSAKFQIDNEIKTLWCETSDTYSRFLLYERSDAFLTALLPFAMRSRKDIVCECPVSEQLLHNFNEILIPHLCGYDRRLYPTHIVAEGASSKPGSGNAVATGMSCGVDSLYTASLYHSSKYTSMKLTHLYCGNYLYGNDSLVYDRAEVAANVLSLPLIKSATNLNEVIPLPHLYTHFFKTMFGVLSLKKAFSIYYYSSAEDFSHFNLRDNSIRDTAEIELLLLYVFSGADFQLITGGGKNERTEKIRAICDFPLSYKVLNVCLYPDRDINCGRCGKCMRTMLALDMLDRLDLYRDVFPLDEYKKNRLEYFVYLVSQKNNVMLSSVYRYFVKKEPYFLSLAEDIYNKDAK